MKHSTIFFIAFFLASGCDTGSQPQSDEQFVKILYQYSFRDEVNTYSQTLTKDLIMDGTITVSFWFTKAEQDLLLSEVNRVDFFNIPDTLKKVNGVEMSPNPSPDLLRIEVDGKQKTVVWSYPVDTTGVGSTAILQLTQAITTIVQSSAVYKQLPAARGGYL